MALNTFTIPLENVPQSFGISLAGTDYIMTVKYNNSPDAGWMMDLADLVSGTSIVAGLPFITGADLLDGLAYLGINGSFFIFTDGQPNAVPTLDNLGVESNLYFQTEIEA